MNRRILRPNYRIERGKPTSYGGATVKLTHICRECGTTRTTPCAYLACPNRRAA